MTCIQFEEIFDRYVDGLLDKTEATAARAHVACCKTCDRSVIRWQQTRILLSTAVAEVSTAVDFSDLSAQVHAALGNDAAAARPAAYDRSLADRPAATGERRSARRSSGRRVASAAWRFGAAASLSAVAAGLFVMLLSPPKAPVRLAEAPAPIESSHAYANNDELGPLGTASDVPATAAGVDALEAAPGHLVSTWVHPKSNARVIWVENRTPIENVDFGR